MKHKILLLILPPIIAGILLFFSENALSSFDKQESSIIYFDIIVDDSRQLIYGSDFNGESIEIVDMDSLLVIDSIFLGGGARPAGLDMSPDGSELAVALYGLGEVAFIDLETLTVTHRLVPGGVYGLNKPFDLLYGRPGRLYSIGNCDSSCFDYVHVFDTFNKIEVGRSSEIIRSAPRLAMTADYNTLFVSESPSAQRIYRFNISSDTPTQTARTPFDMPRVKTIAVNPGGSKVYTSRGQVWNGDLDTQLGSFPLISDEIEYAAGLNRFYVTNEDGVHELNGDSFSIFRSFVILGSVGIARLNSAETILYVSTDTGIQTVALDEPPIALETINLSGPASGETGITHSFTATVAPISATLPVYYTWQATDVPSVFHYNGITDTLDLTWLTEGTKAITVTATNFAGTVITATHTITITGPPIPLPVTYFDIVVDEARQLIYGSDFNGDFIHVIGLANLQVVTSIPLGIGARPAGLDMSPDGDEMAAALYGLGEIAFIDLDTQAVTDRLVPEGVNGPNRPYDLLYGRPGRLYSVGNCGSECFDYAHVFDTVNKIEVRRSSTIVRGAPRLAMTADHNTLFVSEASVTPQNIFRFDISTDTPVLTAQGPHGPVQVNTLAVNSDGSKVYSSRGQVWNDDLDTQLGSFSPGGDEIEYVADLNRFYITDESQVYEFDGDSFSLLRSFLIYGSAGVARVNSAANTLYVSTEVGIQAVAVDGPITPLESIGLSGPASGETASTYVFTATVSPISATLPVFYTWQATNIPPITQINEITDTFDITWLTPGTKAITVTATNYAGVVVTGTQTISITGPSIPLPVRYFDIVIDDARQLIYGSDFDGESIHVIDKATLCVIYEIPLGIGAHPAGLDMSPDGDELAVALYSLGEVAFIDLDTQTVTDRLVPEGVYGPNRPYDLLYGRPGRLYSVGSPRSNGLDYVHVFDTINKIEVGRSTNVVRNVPRLTMKVDNNTLYVGELYQILRFNISSDTPIRTAQTPSGVSVDTLAVNPAGSKVYTSRGQVWNGSLNTQLGSFSPGGDEIEYVAALNRFYITTGAARVYEFDGDSFLPLRYFPFPESAGVARVNSAATTLFVSTDVGIQAVALDGPSIPLDAIELFGPASGETGITQYFMASVSPISATIPVLYTWQATDLPPVSQYNEITDTFDITWFTPGTKAITVTATNYAGVVVTGTQTISITGPSIPLPVRYFDIVIDDARQLIYGSDFDGDSIHVIDMTTLGVITFIPLGIEAQPAGLDISPDGDELAVALFGSGEVAFIDLDNQSITARLVPEGVSGPNRPYDLLYGRPGRLYSVGNNGSGGFDYVHVFDTINKIEVGRSSEIMRAAPRLAMTADHNTLFISQVSFSPQKIYRFDISADIPVQTAQAPHGPVQVNTLAVNSDGSKVYSSRGQVWNGDLNTQLGSFGPGGNEIEYVADLNRFYITYANYVYEFDGINYETIHIYPLSALGGVARLSIDTHILYVSTVQGIETIQLDKPSLPILTLDINGPVICAINIPYTYTVSASPITATQPITYIWEISGQEPITVTNQGLTNTLPIEWVIPGINTVQVTAVNEISSVTTSLAVDVQDPFLSLSITGAESGFTNVPYTFTAAVEPISTTLPITYVWRASQHLPITYTNGITNEATFAWYTTGPQHITVTAANILQVVTATHTITLYETNQADFIAVPVHGIEPLQAAFTNTSTGDYTTSLWDFGDGTTGTEHDPIHNYIDHGVYTVTLTVDGPGGSDTKTKTDYITVYEPVQAEFSALPTSGIAPLSVNFTNLSGGEYDSCFWDFGDGVIRTSCTDQVHLYSTPGTYTVSLIVSGLGGTDVVTKESLISVIENSKQENKIYLPSINCHFSGK